MLLNGVVLQLLEVPVRLPAFKPPKVATMQYEAPQLTPLPEQLDDTVRTFPFCFVCACQSAGFLRLACTHSGTRQMPLLIHFTHDSQNA